MTTTDVPAGLTGTLPGSHYTDEDVFRREQAAIVGRSWNCVCRTDALPRPGQFLRADLAGESVLVVRGRDGRLRAFRNLCRHRGARLCLDDSGELGKAIRCPYHSWTYGLDGRLIAAPNMRDMPELAKENYGLHELPATEWLGYLWLTLHPDPPPLADQVNPQIERRLGDLDTLSRYGIERLGLARTIRYEVASNWKSIVENFTECYHCASIHPELTAALPQFASGYGTISSGVGAGAHFADGRSAFSVSGTTSRPLLPGLLPSDDRLFYGIILLPTVFLILVPDHVAVYRVEPRSAGHTTVTVDWLFDRAEMARPGFDPDDAVTLLDITNRQDFDACERCQLGMRSDAFAGVLVPAEYLITEFHDYVRRALAGDRTP